MKLDERWPMEVTPAVQFAQCLSFRIGVDGDVAAKPLRVLLHGYSDFAVSARAVVVAGQRRGHGEDFHVKEIHHLNHFFRTVFNRREVRVCAEVSMAVINGDRRFHAVALRRS
jgi:hypothetical protein